MEQLLEELLESCQPYTKDGKLADYIPELLKADPNALGIYVMRPDGKRSWAGDCSYKFTIQSVEAHSAAAGAAGQRHRRGARSRGRGSHR